MQVSRWQFIRRVRLLGFIVLCGIGVTGLVILAPSWMTNHVAAVSIFMGTALMSPRDVGRLLNLSASRVVQLEKEGLLPAERDSSGRRFFQRAVVEQFALERAARITAASRNKEGRFAASSATPLVIVSRSIGQDDHVVPSASEESIPR